MLLKIYVFVLLSFSKTIYSFNHVNCEKLYIGLTRKKWSTIHKKVSNASGVYEQYRYFFFGKVFFVSPVATLIPLYGSRHVI